jgi:inosine/xanthosine triphosphate pyrophosphatase family protein
MAHRRFTDRQLVIASHNAGKAREIAELLAPFGIAVISAAALNLPEPEETGTTFVANAELKARAAATAAALPALADDSGLVVEALDGAPGIYSARWAGPTKDFAIAMKRVDDALRAKSAPISSPRWRCAGPTATASRSRAGSTARWYGRRAAAEVSAMTPFSCRTATSTHSARWSRRPSTPSATAPTPSAS